MVVNMQLKCCVKGCKRDAAVKKHQLCWGHLQRFYRHGETGNGEIRKKQIRPAYNKSFGEFFK
jgi:hypothetical protein